MTSSESATAHKMDDPAAGEVAAKEFFFPNGLLGFPAYRRYRLAPFQPADGSASPFLVLSAVDEELSFPVLHPASVNLQYELPLAPELLTALGARSQDEIVPLLIVTVRERIEDITINLQGPLALNPNSALGMQLVIEHYPVRHPLLKRV